MKFIEVTPRLGIWVRFGEVEVEVEATCKEDGSVIFYRLLVSL